jgi:hypothetical protein
MGDLIRGRDIAGQRIVRRSASGSKPAAQRQD